MRGVIKVWLLSLVLFFNGCLFFAKPKEVLIGTINSVKQKDITNYVLNIIGYKTYSYKLEITTTQGIILKVKYKDKPNKYKPGDFVKVIIQDNRVSDIIILQDRELLLYPDL